MKVSPHGTVQRPSGERKLTLPFPSGLKSMAVPGKAPLASAAAGIVQFSWDEPCPVPSVCLENEPQGRALQAEHEQSVRPGLPGALAELPLPYLSPF